MDPLTDQQRSILDLEQRFWLTAGEKEEAIRALNLSPVRYYQLLNQTAATEAALTYAAVTVKRLLRLRAGCEAGYASTD